MKHLLLTLTLAFSAALAYSQSSCLDAEPIDLGLNTTETLSGESPETDCNGLNTEGLSNWFTFNSSEDQTLLLTTSLTQNSGWDSRLIVYSGSCDELICVGGDDDGGSFFTSDYSFDATEGTTYFIVFDNLWSDSGGDFYLGNAEDVENYVDPGSGGGGDGGGGDGGGGGGDPETPETLIVFENVTPANFVGGDCVLDMNGDYLDDVVQVNGSTVTVSYQQEDGSFSLGTIVGPNPEHNPSWSITGGDLDNNGFNDLMYGGGGGVSLMMRTDDGTEFTEYASDEYVFSQRGNMADINMDGILDAFMCHDVDANVYFISDGEGGFEYYQGGLGDVTGNYGSVWIDYNNDCLLDMFIAKCGSGPINQMHRNNGDGTYTEVGNEINMDHNIQTWSSAWGDYDNDGDMDCFIGASSTSNGSHAMMRNDDGVFVDITAETGITFDMPTGIEHCAHDFNNDGFVDIDIAGSTVLLNNGDFTFTHSGVAMSNGAVGDLNDDGYLDVVSPWNGLFLNQETGNNFIKINTIGTVSNKNGIGARITVESELGTQIRDVKSGDGFGYMSSLSAHFGLGQDTEIYSITVCWPSGITTTVEGQQVNTTLNLVEVEGTVLNIEDMLEEKFTVYPNPTSDFLNVSTEMNFNNFPVEVLNLEGKVVQKALIKDNRISVAELSTGTYFIRINANGAFHQVQFIKE